MDSSLYDQKLVGHRIFKDLKDNLHVDPNGKLRNLLELKDDVLYIWNPTENCLWCLNLKQLEEHGDETPYQKLHLLTPPVFDVERVMASPCGSRICVWGARGVTVAELPSRWGRAGLFDSTNQTVICKCHTLDERLLYSQGEVRRVHWHPTSLSHVMVLVSDNTIRLYSIALKSGPKLVKLFTIGPKPSSLISGRTLLESLGDTAVDFTPLPETDTLLVLRGNGDVYMLNCELDGKSPPKCIVRGPLSMFPPADDNYGSESCCIAALTARRAPPLLVLASASAALYHCLLLPTTNDGDEDDSYALYVVEAVELNTTDDALHSYPVHIYPCSETSYAVVHAAGVHTVTLPILKQLTEFAMADDVECEGLLSTLCSARSGAQHALRLAPSPAGLALSPPPLPHLLVLTQHAQLLTRILEPFDLEDQLYKELQLKNPALLQDDINDILKERQKLSFTSIMQEILSRDVSQPILNIRQREEPTPQECLEVACGAAVRLRSEYVCRQARACAVLSDKLRAMAALSATHAACLQHLQDEAADVQGEVTRLTELCILAEKRQEDLKYRCSAVIRGMGAGGASPAERQLLAQLQDTRRRAGALALRLHNTRQHAARSRHEMKQWKEDYKRKDVALGKSHSDTIATILQEQTLQISTVIEETKLLKDQLSIV